MSDISRPLQQHETTGRLCNAAIGRPRRSNEWSSPELRLLRELASTGTPIEAIAATMCRTASAIRNKAGMHGISLKGRR